MKAKDLRDQSLPELDATYQDTRRKLFDLNNQFKAQKNREKPHQVKQTRKDIARLLTVMTEKRRKQEHQAR